MLNKGEAREFTREEMGYVEALRTKTVTDYPYLSYVIFQLKLYAVEYEDLQLPTMGVAGSGRVSTDPLVFTLGTSGEQSAALIHNTNPVIRDHSNRGTRFLGESSSSDEQARHIWSVSTDAEINDDIAEQF